jgi:hypothetical protein
VTTGGAHSAGALNARHQGREKDRTRWNDSPGVGRRMRQEAEEGRTRVSPPEGPSPHLTQSGVKAVAGCRDRRWALSIGLGIKLRQGGATHPVLKPPGLGTVRSEGQLPQPGEGDEGGSPVSERHSRVWSYKSAPEVPDFIVLQGSEIVGKGPTRHPERPKNVRCREPLLPVLVDHPNKVGLKGLGKCIVQCVCLDGCGHVGRLTLSRARARGPGARLGAPTAMLRRP